MRRNSLYIIENITEDAVTIRDMNGTVSVTNDAENVVEELVRSQMLGKKALHYYDSDGNLDQILVDEDGKFEGFAPIRNENV